MDLQLIKGSVLRSIRTREWCHLVYLQLINVASSSVYVCVSGAIYCAILDLEQVAPLVDGGGGGGSSERLQ